MTTSLLPSVPRRGVLVASPIPSLREQVLDSLHDRGCPVQQVGGGADALAKLESGNWQVLFLDRCLPDLDAEELVEIIKRRFPGIAVVVLDTASGQIHPASSASGFLLQRWLAPAGLAGEGQEEGQEQNPNGRAGEEAAGSEMAASLFSPPAGPKPATPPAPLPGMIGTSEPMQRLYRLARLVAPRPTTVLVTGPTGTGKELVARALHQLSLRAARAFVVVNCAAIPEALLESELFGHVRGAFTGAVQSYPGRIYAAQGGTLFLDEIGELPLSLQAKLLRFLDQKEVQRLGSVESVRVDARVVAATNADLAQAVESGEFRRDLYYRLAAFPLVLPPLSERGDDVALLADHFLRRFAAEWGLPVPRLAPEAAARLQAQAWPGNVRELQQVMERSAILAGAGAATIHEHHIYFPARGSARPGPFSVRGPGNRLSNS